MVVAVLVEVVVVVVVMVEEMMTEISATMIGAGGLEAAVLDVEGREVGALGEGGIGVRSGKAVLKGGLRLNNGIGKRKMEKVVLRTMRATLMMTGMALHRTVISMMTWNNSSSSMVDTITRPKDFPGLSWHSLLIFIGIYVSWA